MRICLNAFVEEIVRRIDFLLCHDNPNLGHAPISLRTLIVARKLSDIGVAKMAVDDDDVTVWGPSQNLEAEMGDSDVVGPVEIDVEQDFRESENIMRYVAAVNALAGLLVEAAVEKAVANTVAYNKGLVKPAGWGKSGHRRWAQTALGEKMASDW